MRAPTFAFPACTSEDDAQDRACVARFRQGDHRAFAELVKRYQRPIFNAAFWVTRRDEDACDVVQSVFLKAAERIDDYDPRFRFFSWIYRIAVNEALNLVRSRERDEPLDDDFDAEDTERATPEQELDQAQRARRLQDAMLKLSTSDRVVLSMRHFSECSYQEIAVVLGLDEKTVKSRLFEARARLRRRLDGLPGQ
ncbi:MAG TPA: sigma-70 family RNA polymerase sigma factor [Burkholderiaceae bacterium]|nr:sigma-70 family RNA polymerase sigma factor [Burkholderiaceae bacterium]